MTTFLVYWTENIPQYNYKNNSGLLREKDNLEEEFRDLRKW